MAAPTYRWRPSDTAASPSLARVRAVGHVRLPRPAKVSGGLRYVGPDMTGGACALMPDIADLTAPAVVPISFILARMRSMDASNSWSDDMLTVGATVIQFA